VAREPLRLSRDVLEPAWRMMSLQPARRDKMARLRLTRHVGAAVPETLLGDATRLLQVRSSLLTHLHVTPTAICGQNYAPGSCTVCHAGCYQFVEQLNEVHARGRLNRAARGCNAHAARTAGRHCCSIAVGCVAAVPSNRYGHRCGAGQAAAHIHAIRAG
jgi:hypothetical protein